MAKIKVLLDTDPGSDIDDAVCLAYLLSHPRCELMGVTTVTGEPEKRAMIASAVCRSYGRDDVPIYPGSARPLVTEMYQREAPHAVVLPRWSHRSAFPKASAIRFLQETIRAHPGEIELLTVGAMTNAALLFAIDPEIPSLLRGLTVMGGRFSVGIPVHTVIEHNIRCDPHAGERCFSERDIPHVRVVGLDVTYQVVQSREEIVQSFVTEPFRPILEMAEEWFKSGWGLCYHDIVAASTIFEPELCSFRRGTISVETHGTLIGFTHFVADEAGPHEVAATVDREAFLDQFCAVTGCTRV